MGASVAARMAIRTSVLSFIQSRKVARTAAFWKQLRSVVNRKIRLLPEDEVKPAIALRDRQDICSLPPIDVRMKRGSFSRSASPMLRLSRSSPHSEMKGGSYRAS